MKLALKSWGIGAVAAAAILMGSPMNLPAQPAVPAAEATSTLSPGALEVLKLVNAGVEQGVLLGFIANSTNSFNLTADDLIHLQGKGVPTNVTTAMLQQDQALRSTTTSALSATTAPGTAAVATGEQPPMSPANINPDEPAVPQFHQALAPYGSWFQVAEWGWVWQPKEAATNAEWRPYLDGGRWAWTDHGWYWESDYPWGWAAFHYGRWMQMEKIGWVWFPDTVWAPSWVTWRYHEDNVGWAPLPPNAMADANVVEQPVVNNYDYGVPQQAYTFVDVRYIFVRNVRPHCIPHPRVKEFYNRCRVVNDFGPGKHHHGVVNRGLPIERWTAATGKHLTPVPVFKGGVDTRRDSVARRSPGFTPAPPLAPGSPAPHTRSPGLTVTDPRTHHGTRPDKPRTTFALPAPPVLPAAPGTPGTSPNPSTTVGPLNPIVPPINPGTGPLNPNGFHSRRSPSETRVTPLPRTGPERPGNSGHAHDRNEERRNHGYGSRSETHGAPSIPRAPSLQPAPRISTGPGAQPKKEAWAIPAYPEQGRDHSPRSRN